MLIRSIHIVAFLLILLAYHTGQAQQLDSLYLAIGYDQYKAADYDSAIINLEKARKLLSTTDKHQDYVYSILYLGRSHGRLANYQKAQEYFDKGLALALKLLGEQNDATIRLYNAIDYNYGGQAKYEEALIYAYKALEIKKAMFGEHDKSIIDSYNSIAFNIRMQGQYDNALIYYQKALELSKQVFENYELEGGTSKTFSGIGWLYAAKGQYSKAMEQYKRAYSISINVFGKDHPTTAQKLKMIAWCANQMGDYLSSLEYSQEAARIKSGKLGENHPHMATTYHDLGRTYMLLGEYDKAIAFQKRGNTIWIEHFGNYSDQMANFNNSLGMSYAKKGNTQKALLYYQRAVEVALKILDSEHLELANTYQLMADLYGLENDHDQQFEYLQKALKISIAFAGKDHINAAMIHRKIGRYFGAVGNFEKELLYYNMALKVFNDTYKTKHPLVAQTMADIGDHYSKIGDIDSALSYYQLSLIQLSRTFSETDVYKNPPLEDIRWKVNALKTLDKKARGLYSKSIENAEEALVVYDLSMQLIDKTKKEYVRESARIDLYKNAKETYQGAIGICYQIYQTTENKKYLEQAFSISERAKSMVLFEVHNTSKATTFANVPDSIIQKERTLKLDVSIWEDKLFKSTNHQDSTQMKVSSESLFFAQNAYDEFIKHLELSNPDYHKLKYANPEVSLSTIQNELLDNKSALLEFFVGDTTIYVFSITKSKTKLFQTNKPTDFSQLTATYRKALSDYNFITSSRKEADDMYVQGATRLYDLLLKEPLTSIMDQVTNLIIIPDGVLWHVNFQTLLATIPDQHADINYKTLDYLIKSYSTSFAHSANILNVLGKKTMKSQVSFAGFAPSYNALNLGTNDTLEHSMMALLVRDGELPLPGALNEVKNIAKLMNGSAFTGSNATENNFKNQAPAFDVLHLAMHSLLNDENPAYTELVFNLTDSLEDGYLSISEIYNLRLTAELVVLSSCNSGYGKIQNGEGPISLSRAFNYAGCPSVVMSLWKIPDKVTEGMMVNFYEHLKKGSTKNEGLRNAQLTHLKETKDPLYQHPYFWSGFLTIGDSKSIKTETKASSPVLILLIILAFITVLYSIELRRSKASSFLK